MSRLLDAVSSLKLKLGVLVALSVFVATALALVGAAAQVSLVLVLPVSVALALAVTQLLAAGMVAPLRQMTEAAGRMARGDYSGRAHTTATDEVGRLAVAFNQMAQDLATVDAERRDLIATVSHELRTPLTAMTAHLENLADGVVPADAVHLDEALDEARRLGRLVEDLLQLSRLEAGVVALERQQLSLADLVAESIEQVSSTGRAAIFDVDLADDFQVVADPARLRQLLVNALDNAMRHAPDGSPVRITGSTRTGGWWLEVADAGKGVAPAERERVFERFGTDGAGGTGLGLAVARWVAQLHGATLRFVDPEGGTGARLRLDVPARHTALPGTSTRKEPTMSTAPPEAPPASPQVQTGGVLDPLFGRFWPEQGRPSSLATALAAAGAGVFAGMAMSFTEIGVTWTLIAVVCGLAALRTARRRREPWSLLCSALALLLVLPMSLLDAWWIQMLALIASAALFLCGVTGARTMSGVALSGLAWPLASLRGLPWFGRSLRIAGTGSRTHALVRTGLWSLLGLGVFGSLFASANPVFGSWVDQLVPNLTFNEFIGRTFLACFVFGLTLAAGYLAINPADVDALGRRRPAALANRFEWLVPVLVVDGVFLTFLAAQARALVGGHTYIEETTGLTYAEFVHQGFGQLTLATVLTVLVVWVAAPRAGRTPTDRRWLHGSLGLLCLLTLLVVASALRGMAIYQDAYGFTTLRLFVDVFEGWLGFVVLAIMVTGACGVGRWMPRIALVSGAVGLIALAAINPEAWVAERNIDRYEASGMLDLDYLRGLSADVAPVIVERLPADVAGCVLQDLPHNTLRPEVLEDARAWNLSRSRAADSLSELALPLPRAAAVDECAPVWAAFEE